MLGCAGNGELACARGIDTKTIQDVALANSLNFSPDIDSSTQMDLRYLPTRAARGLAPVPLLIGSTVHEGPYLALLYGSDLVSFTGPVPKQFIDRLTGGGSNLSMEYYKLYRSCKTAVLLLFHAASHIYTEIVY